MRYIIFLILFTPMVVEATVQLTPQNLISYVDKNYELENLKDRLMAAEKMQGHLLRSFLPVINLNYGNERYKTGPYNYPTQTFGGIEAKINIYNSGKDALQNDKNNLAQKIAAIDNSVLKAQIISEIKKAMSNHAYLVELKNILEEAIINNQSNLTASKKRTATGLTTVTDQLDFKQQHILYTQDLQKIEFDLGVNYRLILILIGKELDEKVEISFENQHPGHETESNTGSLVNENHFLLKKSTLNYELAQTENKLDKRWWAPSLDIYTSHLRYTQKEREYHPESKRDDTSIGIKLTWPIFDGGHKLQSAKASTYLAEAELNMLKHKKLEIDKQSIDASKKLELAHQLIHSAEENVTILTQYRQNILAEYSRGVKNSPDVMQADQRWSEAKILFAEIKKNYTFASIEADFINGKFHN